MKNLITILMCLLAINTYSQNQETDYSQNLIEIDYYPEQKKGITDKAYNRGKYTLDLAYKQLKESDGTYVFGDFWNVATAYTTLGEQPEKIYKLLTKVKSLNPKDFCFLIGMQTKTAGGNVNDMSFYKSIGEKFLNLIASCSDVEKWKDESLEDMMAKKQNLDLSGLDEPLIDRLIVLFDKEVRSQHYNGNVELVKMREIELEAEVIKIFEKYGYPGKDIVGQPYQDYMCMLLERTGKLAIIDKYLPLVAGAFKDKQIGAGAFKMLIDRMYVYRSKTQIFGSHGQYPYADDEEIKRVKLKYNL